MVRAVVGMIWLRVKTEPERYLQVSQWLDIVHLLVTHPFILYCPPERSVL